VGPSTHDRERTAVSLAFLLFGVVGGSLVPRLPAFKDHLHLTDGQIGFALLMFAVGAIAGSGLARVVLSRGSRGWVRVFTVVLCLGLIPVGLAANLAELVLAVLITQLEVFRRLFGTVELTLDQWALSLLPAVLLVFVWELGKLIARRATDRTQEATVA